MTIRVGINGFGRIGRLALRAGWDSDEIEIVHLNDPFVDAETAAHLLEFDSVHGRWARSVYAEQRGLEIGNRSLTISRQQRPSDVAWQDARVELVLECSGKFRTLESLEPYHKHGVRKVIVSAPVRDGVFNIVMGCNDHLYDPEQHHIITAASCTTNCLAPVVKSRSFIRGLASHTESSPRFMM